METPTLDQLIEIWMRAKAWAKAHGAHHLPTDINVKGPERYVPRSKYLAAEKALLDVLRTQG